jgi:8-oxo-dGTP pyrophosphatase MutT (NUDIX family)
MVRTAAPPYARTEFEHELKATLEQREKTVLSPAGMTVAAVLVPLFRKDGTHHVLLTKRSDKVEHHKGEVSFPGGKLDNTDPDMLSCALRETEEEVGIDPAAVRIIGELDDFYTVATQYLVVPFVGFIPYPYKFRPSDREIDEILDVPIDIFFDPSRRENYTVQFGGRSLDVISYQWKHYHIWGATARILEHFADLIEAIEDGEDEK